MIHVLMPRLSLLATLGMLGASVLKDQVCLIARRSCIVPSFPTIYTVLSLLLGKIDYCTCCYYLLSWAWCALQLVASLPCMNRTTPEIIDVQARFALFESITLECHTTPGGWTIISARFILLGGIGCPGSSY